MAGERRLDGRFRSLQVAHFADQHDVGIVTEDAQLPVAKLRLIL
jgi:hypothetical protein